MDKTADKTDIGCTAVKSAPALGAVSARYTNRQAEILDWLSEDGAAPPNPPRLSRISSPKRIAQPDKPARSR
jgi:hypothetical protein